MTHLRSRETIPKTPLKTLRNRIIEPSTPRKSHEPSHPLPSPSVMISSPSSFSSPDQKSDVLDSASGSGTAPRRSLRLASKSKVGDDDSGKVLVSGSRRGRRRRIAGGNAVGMNAKKDGSSDSDSENLKGESARVLDSRGKRVRVSDSSVEKARVSGEGDLGNVVIEKQMMGFAEEEDGVLKENEMDLDSLGDGEGGEIKEKCGSNISKLGSSSDLATQKDIDLNWPPSNLTAGDGDCNGFLNLRSRAGFAKRKMMEIGVDSNGIVNGGDRLVLNEREGGGERRENEGRLTCGSGEVIDLEKLKSDRSSDEITPFKGETRYSREEKGKRKLTKESWLSIGIDPVELDLDPEAEHLIENAVSGLSLPETSDHLIENAVSDRETLPLDKKQMAKMRVRAKATRRRGYRERFLDTARQNASRFAHFQAEGEEDNNVPPDRERGMPSAEADEEIEDWPGPFSTAMKIINDRTMKPNGRQESTSSGVSKPVPVIEWMPKKEQFHHSKLSVPSLQDLCLSILAKNADALISLTHVPDVLKHKLSQMLCDSRRMDSHFMDLLVSGCPTEIRVKDCSWITEEQIKKTLEGCNKQNIVVLQLDQCGRCMPDYILRDTLARLPNSLPALTTICLKGACRLSDVGLKALVASAPAIRSINLGQCSLLTSTGIITLADSLGSVLRELYIDDCPNIDAMLILPALKKIEHLEVLSVASVSTVCDDFVSGLIAIHGPNMKELVLSDCKELTDTSIKAIAETCSGLCALDLYNLYKLTDCAIRYLANGCRSIQKLKLRRNPFSDEAIAAFLEASGESLTELSLNNITKVGHNTAISLARRSRKLLSLDLSFCRNLTDEALGLIVDSCLSLKLLRLFGCTQITNVFLDGHSNPHVRIIGLKMSPILECLDTLDCLEAPLRYSSFSF